MRPEQIVAEVHGLPGKIGRFGTASTYNVVFTDRRVVGVVAAYRVAVPGPYAYPNPQPVPVREPRHSPYDPAGLDALVAANPANFSLAYERIDSAKIGGVVRKSLSIRVDSATYVLEIPREKLEEMRAIVARRIPGADV